MDSPVNLYATLDQVKADLAITSTAHDAPVLGYLEAVSRAIDRYCDRFFYVEQAVRYQTPVKTWREVTCPMDADLLSVTAFATDSEGDGTYDGESWVENTDYWLWPFNKFPKTKAVLTPFGGYGFEETPRYVKVTGAWGFGDGRSANPVVDAGAAATVASTTGTTITVNAIGSIQAGHTLLIGTEQVFVSAVSSLNLTVRRGMNGTTAAIHAAAAASIYEYPADVSRFAAWMAATEYKQRDKGDMQQERMGDYFYSRIHTNTPAAMLRILGPYRRTI